MIRAALAADCPRLAEIDAAGNLSPWSEQQFQTALSAKHDEVCLIEQNGTAAAFIVWQSVCGESELHLIATAPEYRRQGLAAALLEHWLEHCTKNACSRLFLEVRAGNEAAQQLYRRFGFTECGRRKNYYPLADGLREDAVLMEKIC